MLIYLRTDVDILVIPNAQLYPKKTHTQLRCGLIKGKENTPSPSLSGYLVSELLQGQLGTANPIRDKSHVPHWEKVDFWVSGSSFG